MCIGLVFLALDNGAVFNQKGWALLFLRKISFDIHTDHLDEKTFLQKIK